MGRDIDRLCIFKRERHRLSLRMRDIGLMSLMERGMDRLLIIKAGPRPLSNWGSPVSQSLVFFFVFFQFYVRVRFFRAFRDMVSNAAELSNTAHISESIQIAKKDKYSEYQIFSFFFEIIFFRAFRALGLLLEISQAFEQSHTHTKLYRNNKNTLTRRSFIFLENKLRFVVDVPPRP